MLVAAAAVAVLVALGALVAQRPASSSGAGPLVKWATVVTRHEDLRSANALLVSGQRVASEICVVVCCALTSNEERSLRALGAAPVLRATCGPDGLPLAAVGLMLQRSLGQDQPLDFMLVHPRSLFVRRVEPAWLASMLSPDPPAVGDGPATSSTAVVLAPLAGAQLGRDGVDMRARHGFVCLPGHFDPATCVVVHFPTSMQPWAWWLGPPATAWQSLPAAVSSWLWHDRQVASRLRQHRIPVVEPEHVVEWRNSHWQSRWCSSAPRAFPSEPPENFSVVVSTYSPRRAAHLRLLVASLMVNPTVEQVLVVWHDPLDRARAAAFAAEWAGWGARFGVVQALEDSLNNRFAPWPQLRSAAVLMLDDDMRLTAADLALMFGVWRNTPDLLVGAYARSVTRASAGGAWQYRFTTASSGYSLVLTKALFLHARFLFMYACMLPPTVHAVVDELVNCEDVAINLMVSSVTRRGPIHVAVGPEDFGVDAPEALSSRPGHYVARTECVNRLAAALGISSMPLVRFRAVPFD